MHLLDVTTCSTRRVPGMRTQEDRNHMLMRINTQILSARFQASVRQHVPGGSSQQGSECSADRSHIPAKKTIRFHAHAKQ